MSNTCTEAAPRYTGFVESSELFASLGDDLRSLIAPRYENDDLTFEELSARYNFRNTSDRRVVFSRLLIRECQRLRREGKPLRVVDIGCGRGMGMNEGYVAALKPWIDELWGIEPDSSVIPPPDIFDEVQHSLFEDASIPENSIDLAFSFMVMEHVENPARFYEAVARCLRPGGVYMFMTPNAKHYFALVTRTLKALHLEEVILRLIGGQGVEEYHYPVQYRCNTPSQVLRNAEGCGFDRVDFAYLESDGPRPYMKGPLRPLFNLLAWKRSKIHKADCLLTLIVRMQRAEA